MRSAGAEWAARFVEPASRRGLRRFTSKRKWWWKDGRQHPEHLFIPDPQIKAGVPIEHMRWAAQYALERKPDAIVVAGDLFDLPSLSMHDVEFADFRMRDLVSDLLSPLHGWDLFLATLRSEPRYDPDLYVTLGNHEDHVDRAFRYDARMRRGFPTPRWLLTRGARVVVGAFQEVICVDGIHYSHFFTDPLSGRPLGGSAASKLSRLAFTFTMGHQQTKETAEKHLANGQVIRGLVAGAFYQHDEDYKGFQGNVHWRGVLYKHEVHDGSYDLMEVSMDYLRRRYGGKRVLASGSWRASEFTYEDDQ